MQIVSFDGEFNYSAVNNAGARAASGDYLLFLNDDTMVVTPEWIERMLGEAQQPGVGIVGAKLLYPDGLVQLGGHVLVDSGAGAAVTSTGLAADYLGYRGTFACVRNMGSRVRRLHARPTRALRGERRLRRGPAGRGQRRRSRPARARDGEPHRVHAECRAPSRRARLAWRGYASWRPRPLQAPLGTTHRGHRPLLQPKSRLRPRLRGRASPSPRHRGPR